MTNVVIEAVRVVEHMDNHDVKSAVSASVDVTSIPVGMVCAAHINKAVSTVIMENRCFATDHMWHIVDIIPVTTPTACI